MKKLFLVVIGLIIMAGTIFSQHNSRNEIPVMAEGIGLFMPVSVVPISVELAAKGIPCKSMIIVEKMNGQDKEPNFSPDENKFICDDCHEVIEQNHPWEVKKLNYSPTNIVDSEHDLTINGIARKRVNILRINYNITIPGH